MEYDGEERVEGYEGEERGGEGGGVRGRRWWWGMRGRSEGKEMVWGMGGERGGGVEE